MRVLIGAALFLAAGSALPAQEMGNLIGEITLPDASPPPQQVLVTLETRGATVESAYCDAEGHFGFYNLVSNPYHVIIRDEAYFPVDEVFVVDPLIQPNKVIHIFLTPRPQPTPPRPPGVASGGNSLQINAARYTQKLPKEAQKEYKAALKADQDGRTDQAIQHYEKALRISPDFYEARNNLGGDYMKAGNPKAAEDQFNQVIQLNPDDSEAYFNLGNTYYLTKQYDKATPFIEKGLARNPKSAFGEYLLGSVCASTGKFAEAEKSLLDARRLDPNMPLVYLELAALYLTQQRNQDAIRELGAFVKQFPHNPLAAKANEALGKLRAASKPH